MKKTSVYQIFTERNGMVNYMMRIIRSYKPLTKDEEAELVKKMHRGGKEGENARNLLIYSNLRYVVTIAKQYQGSFLPLEDLLQEGFYGLMVAISRFDGEKGVRIVSYADKYIRGYISHLLGRDNKYKMEALFILPQFSFGEDTENDNWEERLPTDFESTDMLAVRSLDKEVLGCALNGLAPLKKRLLEEYYGCNGQREKSVTELAMTFGCTERSIENLLKMAQQELRRSPLLAA